MAGGFGWAEAGDVPTPSKITVAAARANVKIGSERTIERYLREDQRVGEQNAQYRSLQPTIKPMNWQETALPLVFKNNQPQAKAKDMPRSLSVSSASTSGSAEE
jgi:hypothetical protein